MDKCICFGCGKELEMESVDNPATISTVYGGLIFRSFGNYGSTSFDPVSKSYKGDELLQIVLCDDCVTEDGKGVMRVYNIDDTGPADIQSF
ncbi:hypothetical protein KAR91_66685 [Candidatus Pacearchaeota archaeon]|nr:hypothetical protein [Candidatus Pacearchaeota archaeon]